MRLLDTVIALDITGWVRGLLSAGISGASTAISAAIVLPSLDSDHFSILTSKFWIAAGAMGLASGIVSIGKFLSAEPLPAMKQVTTTTQTVVKAPAIITTSTVEMHSEPVDPKDGK